MKREVGERDGKQVVLNQPGREIGSHQGPFGGVTKVVSMPSGSRAPPLLFPMTEGSGRGRQFCMAMGEGCCK